MPQDLTPIEARFKQILFLGVEEIQATKGALYLLDEDKYKLITFYGHKQAVRREVEMSDELVRHFKFQRVPLLINAPEDDRRFAARLAAEDSSRMIVVPVYSHGRLTGFFDLRDKAAKKPFTQADVDGTQRLVDQLLALYVEWDMFEHGSLLSPEGDRQVQEAGEDYRPLARLVEGANAAIENGILRGESDPVDFGEPHFAAATPILAAVVALPGALITSFATGDKHLIAARSTLTDEALIEFERRAQEWLRRQNDAITLPRAVVQYPFGTTLPIAAGRIVSMSTVPVKSSGGKAFLTIAFETAPSPEVVKLAESFLRQLGDLLSLAGSWQQLHRMRKAIAESLLQPPSQQFQTLVAHSYRVAGLAGQLGRSLRLTTPELDNIELSAMLHDVGMRLLDYQRLYRKAQVTEEELRLMRAHNAIGAVVIAQSPLGKEIARDVYHHHDRFDAKSVAAGPVGPRIIHLCESFDAMTSPDSYKAPKPVPAALEVLAAEAGRQFDPDLVRAFTALVR
jgi:hypothetical protein